MANNIKKVPRRNSRFKYFYERTIRNRNSHISMYIQKQYKINRRTTHYSKHRLHLSCLSNNERQVQWRTRNTITKSITELYEKKPYITLLPLNTIRSKSSRRTITKMQRSNKTNRHNNKQKLDNMENKTIAGKNATIIRTFNSKKNIQNNNR